MSARRQASDLRLQAYGLVYLVIVSVLVWFSIASYRHDFTHYVNVDVTAKNVGDQLNVNGDVRMNGALVGRVASVQHGVNGASVHLQINSSDADRIPRDVVARILPTTLFGQKYVELVSSTTGTASNHLTNGSVIPEDHSIAAVELETALNDLYPVLNRINPAQLSSTLGSLAEGLNGRGDDIRALMASAADYLAALNKNAPLVQQDLQLLSSVSGQYSDDMPAFLALLQRATTLSNTLNSATLAPFLTSASQAASAGQALLSANQRNLAQSLSLTRPTLDLLARYAPEIGCVIGGFLENQRLSAAQVRNNSVRGYFTIGQQANGYTTKDQLKDGDTGTGPHCSGLPVAPTPYPAVTLNDGVRR